MPNAPSFARRALAYLVDLGVVYLLAVVTLVGCVAVYGQVKFGGDPRLMTALAAAKTTRNFVFWAHAAIYFSYFTIAQWYAGRTIGKVLFGLRVCGAGGADLSFGRSVARTFGYIVSGQLTLGVGFLLPLFRQDRRALHDIITATFVRRVRYVEVPDSQAAGNPAAPASNDQAA
jgi:uncharacterized RDD family membrane protein YckC